MSGFGPATASLDGRVAIVTGAAKGIGAAVAAGLRAFGATVEVCDRDADALADAGAVLDVRNRDAVDAFCAEVTAAHGRIDIVVNNAGGGFEAPFLDLSPGGQDALVAENFTSVTNVVRAAVPSMPPGGSIVNITSVEAHRAAPGFAVYAAMKAAVANLSHSLALELADREIRVNCIAPDAIPTPGVGDLGQGDFTTPLGRLGHVDDVAGAVVFLASPLSAFITGTTIHVDGGTWAAGGWRRDTEGRWRP